MATLEEILARSRAEQEELARQEAAEQEQQQQKLADELVAALKPEFEGEFTPEILAAWPPVTYRVNNSSTYMADHFASIIMEFAQITWKIALRDAKIRTSGWHVTAQAWGHSINEYTPSRGLQSLLLYHMDREQEALRKRELAEKLAEQRDAEARREYARKEAEDRAAWAAKVAQADAIHERLHARWTTIRAEAEQQMWRWPENFTLTLYKVSYQIGFGFDEDGDLRIDYGEGYTATAGLDGGRLTLMPIRSTYSRHPGPERRLLLNHDRHLPVWQEVQFSGTEELPELLTEAVTVTFPGVVQTHCSPEGRWYNDGKARFIEVKMTDEPYSENIGVVPLAWIRALVDARA